MIFVKEVEELFVDFHIPDRAFGNDEFLGVEVDVFAGPGEAGSLFGFGFGAFLNTFADSEAFAVSPSEFAERPAH